MRVTASNLLRAINSLPRDREYNYVHKGNKGRIVIHNVTEPEGPVEIRRYDPSKGGKLADATVETISSQMLWRMANALLPGRPVNIDKVFGGSYNTRSVLEALLAHTPEFYACRPGRIASNATSKSVEAGHKYLLYLPDEPHRDQNINWKRTDLQISEIAIPDLTYEGFAPETLPPNSGMNIEQQRRHSQIQIALVLIGAQLGFRTWVAANDRAIQYAGKLISSLSGVIDRLEDEQVLTSYPKAVRAARLVDCIWFRNGRLMPAVMEIEHSTGVTPGLTRMKGFYDEGPALRDIRWTIVAPDDDRAKVMQEANRDQFRMLRTRFFPYSAVEELYSLCERRKPKGITDEFLDCFMEPCVRA
jgi:hypothetical protein